MKTLEANKMEPFEPTHPGEVIKDEIEYRGISQRALAAQIGVSYTQLNEVLNGKRTLNTELALLISAAPKEGTAGAHRPGSYPVVSRRNAGRSRRRDTTPEARWLRPP